MQNSRMRRLVALGASGAVAVAACLSVGAAAALAATDVPNVTTDAVALEVGDTVQTDQGLGLVCIPGKSDYLIGYRGILKMAPVIDKWKELKAKGKEMAQAMRPNWYAYDSTFAALRVSGTFEFSFKVDKDVVSVNETKLKDIAAWKAAYEAVNTESAFPQHMVIDEGQAPTYDPATGQVTVHFKLKDGLTAGELDKDYETLQTLKIDSLPGLLSVSKEHFKNVDDNAKKFLLTEPKVTGTFDPPQYVGGDWRLIFGIPAVMGSIFPVTFGQPADSVAPLVTKSTYHMTYSYRSTTGETLPGAVMDTLPQELKQQDSEVDPMLPALGTEIKDGDNTWTFQGWEHGTQTWNEDPQVSADCRMLPTTGMWALTKPEPTPEPTVTPTVEPTAEPTVEPTVEPTMEPTASPTSEPSLEPTSEPTVEPSAEPTTQPTVAPTATPSAEPTSEVTVTPTMDPTSEPTVAPTAEPTASPSDVPTVSPGAESSASADPTHAMVSPTNAAMENPKAAKKNAKLASTGSDVLTVGGVAIVLALAAAGVVALRRRHS